jgi:hypothetical protein
MAGTDDHDLERAVDAVLDPVWGRETRRARRHQVADGVMRLSVLLAFIALMGVVTGVTAILPMLVFFALLGAVCIFGLERRDTSVPDP